MIRFLKAFIENNNGPKLEAAMKAQLSEAERNALIRMLPDKKNSEEDTHHHNHSNKCHCGHHHHH